MYTGDLEIDVLIMSLSLVSINPGELMVLCSYSPAFLGSAEDWSLNQESLEIHPNPKTTSLVGWTLGYSEDIIFFGNKWINCYVLISWKKGAQTLGKIRSGFLWKLTCGWDRTQSVNVNIT